MTMKITRKYVGIKNMKAWELSTERYMGTKSPLGTSLGRAVKNPPSVFFSCYSGSIMVLVYSIVLLILSYCCYRRNGCWKSITKIFLLAKIQKTKVWGSYWDITYWTWVWHLSYYYSKVWRINICDIWHVSEVRGDFLELVGLRKPMTCGS